jgi:hypothetical protein
MVKGLKDVKDGLCVADSLLNLYPIATKYGRKFFAYSGRVNAEMGR